MSDRTAGWRQGPDGQWYPPVGAAHDKRPPLERLEVPLADLAALVNSGDVTCDIDTLVDDPELEV